MCTRLLQTRRRVADVGCGEGWSAIGLALGYPDRESTATTSTTRRSHAARRNAAAHGVTDRVSFTLADGGELVQTATYDVVFAFECIHDLPDPVAVLSTMRRIAKPGAPVIVMDERTADCVRPRRRSGRGTALRLLDPVLPARRDVARRQRRAPER